MFPSAPPPNHHVQFALKLSVQFTPPSTPPKSPSPIYPQIVCTIYPPEIAKSDLPSNRQVQFTLKSSVRFTPPQNRQVRFTLKSPSPIYPQIICTIYPPEIAKSNLPSNRQVRFTLKSSVQFTPPEIAKSDLPSNHQVRFTLKLPSPIYPQIVCMIYPPLKSPSPIYPQIAKSNLPSNHLYNLPPLSP